jgi:predicted enzyme related to lactoylglutathione lyase
MSVIKYVHTNILAKDWKALSRFYIDVGQLTEVYLRDPEGNIIELQKWS